MNKPAPKPGQPPSPFKLPLLQQPTLGIMTGAIVHYWYQALLYLLLLCIFWGTSPSWAVTLHPSSDTKPRTSLSETEEETEPIEPEDDAEAPEIPEQDLIRLRGEKSPQPVPMPSLEPEPSLDVSQHLTLAEALTLAETYNLELQAAKFNTIMGKQDVHEAGHIPNPQFTGNFSMGDIVTVLSNPQQLGFNQLIETAGKRHKRKAVAQSVLDKTTLDIEALRWRIRGEVRQAYAELIGAYYAYDAVRIQSKLLDKLVDIALQRYENGAASGAELQQAQLARHQIVIEQNTAKARIAQTRLALNSLLGNHLSPQFQLADNGLYRLSSAQSELAPSPFATLPEVTQLISLANQAHPSIRSLQQEEIIVSREEALTHAKKIPDLLLTGGYLFAQGPLDGGGSRYYDGPYMVTTFDLPIFHNQDVELAKLKTRKAQLALTLEDQRRQLLLDINQAFAALSAFQQNMTLFETSLLPESNRVLHLSQRGYDVGKTPLANVILAQQNHQTIIKGYTDTITAYQQAWGLLEQAVGAPLTIPKTSQTTPSTPSVP